MAKLQNPSNTVTHEINYQNLRGRDYPLPRLKCVMWAPHVIHPEYHCLDREELELFNLVEPGHYVYTKTDGETEPLAVVARMNERTGKLERLKFECDQFNRDFRGQRLPGMRIVLREILEQHAGDIPERAKAVMTMREERRKIASGELAVTT